MLIASNKRIPLKLRVEKWGNEAELATRIRLQDEKVASSWESGSDVILFDKNWKAFTLCDDRCGPRHEFEFT